jgi:RNA polymerase primary sigma factor
MPVLAARSRPRKKHSGLAGKSARRSDPSLAARLERLFACKIEYVPNPGFDDPRVVRAILADCRQPLRSQAPTDAPRPRAGLPAYLASLYESTLLSAADEQRLFRQMNFLKFHAWKVRGGLGRRPRREQLDQIERMLREAEDVRNELVRSNLRLVVAIARQTLDAEHSFDDLVSEGNIALMRAVEKFDFARGFRFSTYATWAIRRAMLHLKAATRRRARRSVGDQPLADVAAAVDEAQTSSADALEEIRLLQCILPQLDDRDRSVIDLRFGLHDQRRTLRQLGAEMGVSKERVRQLELRALARLREMAASQLASAPEPSSTPA